MLSTRLKKRVVLILRKYLIKILPEISSVTKHELQLNIIQGRKVNVSLGKHIKIQSPSNMKNSKIGDYTYISKKSNVINTQIGKFCSIGPNLLCGWGIHPTNGLSTHPMFYSSKKQNGITLSDHDKIEEYKPITIGNDVFIGANVTILDGVTIGNGAIIGAGAVVNKDIPAYAIAVGCPIKIIRYRFEEEKIEKLNKIEWWNFNEEELKKVEKHFWDPQSFIDKNYKIKN